jgi:hypothetical protein
MMSELYPPPSEFRWRELYRAALFEPDPGKVEEGIARAESAIVLRARQLFGESGDHVEEEQDLDDALYALQALRGCMLSRTSVFNAA